MTPDQDLLARNTLSHGRRWRPGFALAMLWLVPICSAAAHFGSQAEIPELQLLPSGKSAEVTQKLCGSCHTVDNFVGLRRNASDWNDTVKVMIAYGAPIDEDQTRVIVEYLAEVFGPTSPPLIDVNRAKKIDLAKLPGLEPTAIETMLDHRKRNGDFKSITQIRELLGAQQFAKIKGYLIVRKSSGAY